MKQEIDPGLVKEWKDRNCHVIDIEYKAIGIIHDLVKVKEYPKGDIILLGELILDIGKRLD